MLAGGFAGDERESADDLRELDGICENGEQLFALIQVEARAFTRRAGETKAPK